MTSHSREIFLLAGEASGDSRGAELIRALRARDPGLTFCGMGGPLMKQEGMEILADVTQLAVVGIVEVLKHYRLFKQTMEGLHEHIRQRNPRAIIGIDYPGFNLRLLKRVRDSHPATECPCLVQYVSPQLWAWDEKRKWKMARYLDLVLCIFPFEPVLYRETTLKAVFVGHPLIESIPFVNSGRSKDLIAFFPGSRQREIAAHMPIFLDVEHKLRDKGLRVTYACANDLQKEWVRTAHPDAEIESPGTLQSTAAAGIVCSGTATLECALAGLPICLVYRVAWPTYWLGRLLIRIPWLAMPNILLQRPLIHELIQSDFTPENAILEILRLAQNHDTRQEMEKGFLEIRELLQLGHAADRAAEEILLLSRIRSDG